MNQKQGYFNETNYEFEDSSCEADSWENEDEFQPSEDP
jgi:hypothetical protein